MGFFDRISQGLARSRERFTEQMNVLLDRGPDLDDDFWDGLEETLILADIGGPAAFDIVEGLRDTATRKALPDAYAVLDLLNERMASSFAEGGEEIFGGEPAVVLFVGINGAGKTTTVGKLAKEATDAGRTVLLGSADTFRAAAIEQLEEWARRANVEICTRERGSDPASVMGAAPAVMGTEGGTAVMQPLTPGNSGPMQQATNFRMDDDSEKKSRKKTVGIVVGLIAGIIAIAAVAMALLGGGEAKVPNVVGQTQDSAVQAIEAAGYVVGDVTEEYSADVVAGRVCKQDPEADSALEKGGKVNIVISKGVEKGSIPDLSGMTAEQAEKAIKDAGYTPQYAGNEVSEADADTVSKQDPAAGKEADKGTTVKYWISTGPEDIEVPNVVGYDQASAKSTLEKAGFTVSVATGSYSDEYAEGEVMSQTPNGGKLGKGETVTITVSKGQDPDKKAINIPNVVGMTQSQAQSALAEAGFRYNVSETSSNSVEKGTVISQSQTGTGKKGDTITITVSTGPSSNGGNGNGNGNDNSDGSGNGNGNTGVTDPEETSKS